MKFFSLIDIGLHSDKRHLDFSVGQMSEIFFKNNHLLSWDGTLEEKKTNRGEIMNNFMPMFSQKMNLPIHYSNRILLHLNKQIKQTMLVYCH
jgi:hypothetical protein